MPNELIHEYLQQLVNNTDDLFILFDLNGQIEFANPAAKYITGYSNNELIGNNLNLLLNDQQYIKVQKIIQTHIKKYGSSPREIGKEVDESGIEIAYTHKNGTIHWLSLTTIFIRDKQNKAQKIFGVGRPIDKMKRTEDALIKSREKYKRLFSNLPEGGLIVDYTGKILEVNNQLLEILGSPSTAATLKINILTFPPLIQSGISNSLLKCIETKNKVSETTYYKSKWGVTRFIRYQAVPFTFMPNGDVQTIQILFEDFTRLKEIQEKYEHLFNNLPIGVLIIDRAGNILEVNDHLLTIVGSPSKEATMQINILSSPLIESKLKDYVLQCINTKQLVTDTIYYTSRWNISFYMKFHILPFTLDENGEVETMQVLMEDVTTLKKAEKRLMEVQKMESLGNLVAGIAHDFNNMLGGILGYASLLENLEEDSQKLRIITGIIKATSRAHDLTQKLLIFGKKSKYIVNACDLNEIVLEVQSMAKLKLMRDVVITSDLGDIPSIDADATQINQLILNLVLNSVESIQDKGKIIISTSSITINDNSPFDLQLKNGTYVILKVADTGKGIPKKVLQHIFEPFYTTKSHGKGLGLATVYGIIEMHNGKIHVESEVGIGTTFYVYFPKGKIPIQKKQMQQSTTVTTGKGNILIIEDEIIIADMAKSIIERLGYNVVVINNGNDAISFYQDNYMHIDLILLDLIMPEMDEKATYIKLKKINPNLKVILSSGYSNPNDLSELIKLGIIDLLPKPYTIEKIGKMLATYL